MQIRLECYGHERDIAVAAISENFNVKKVSKGYPNTRQTAVEGAPCEARYYLTLDDRSPVNRQPGLLDALTADMFRLLALLQAETGLDPDAEIQSLRKLYTGSAGFTDRQLVLLFSEWRHALLGRCFNAMRSGPQP